MEYAKDEVFNIKYRNDNEIQKEGTSSIINIIKKNSFIKLIIGITIILCISNCICIYNFFSILSNL